MILTVLSWGWIGITSFLCGFAFLQSVFPREEKKYYGLEFYILSGLCVLTVYAQIFSLFYKVGKVATGILGVVCLALCVGLRKKIWNYLKELISSVKPYVWIGLAVTGLLSLLLTMPYTMHYDTGLYHAQSIRWIEEYGIVKGLGNLHNRFAYNSAFFSLQALFSLKFLVNQSLNTLNGFVTFLMFSYAVLSQHLFRKEKTITSDLFKLGIIVYLFFSETKWLISSPGSDLLALTLVLYLCAKWCELIEEGCHNEKDYGVLCVLAVWAITVKLSVAMLVLLAIYPAAQMIRGKKWKMIAAFIGTGLLVALPFFARNVIISGYLLYPSTAVDVFDVDWKMAESVARNDSKEIAAWGRNLCSPELYDEPAKVWLPLWYEDLSVGYRILVWLNIVCVVAAIGYAIYCLKKRDGYCSLNLLLSCCAGLGMWFLSAPLLRYGMVYMMLLPAFFIGMVLEKRKCQTISAVCVGAFLICSIISVTKLAMRYGVPPLKRPLGYCYYEMTEETLEGITFYIPVGSDQAGYDKFPSTPNIQRLKLIEFREAGNLGGGFRLKEEYRDKNIMTGGTIIEQQE